MGGTLPCNRESNDPLRWLWAIAKWQERVDRAEAVNHSTTCVDEGVACSMTAGASGHGEEGVQAEGLGAPES